MSQTRSTTPHVAVRTFATLVAMSVALAPFAFAADQSIATTVTATNTLSLNPGGAVALAPTVAADAVDATTVLAFDTNDGLTYRITVVASAWTFDPLVTSMAANSYPVLRFVSATATAGTPSTTVGVLIDAGNLAKAAVDVVTAITSAEGTATVTLDASIGQTVVAGAYGTTLTYVLTTP